MPAIGPEPGSGCASARNATASLTAISLVSYGTAGVGLGAGVGNIAEALYACPNFDMRAARRVHQCRAGLRDARAGQYAGRLRARASDRRTGRDGLRSIRSRCATVSTPVRCGARSGASAPNGSAGSAGTRPAPIRAR